MTYHNKYFRTEQYLLNRNHNAMTKLMKIGGEKEKIAEDINFNGQQTGLMGRSPTLPMASFH